MYEFRWNEWNVDHIGEHGVSPKEAEHVVQNFQPPYPEYRGDDKWRVVGKTPDGEWIQVVYIFSPASVVFVIHARPLTAAEKRRTRKRRR
jgi:uncharacterized DUF497 family protein